MLTSEIKPSIKYLRKLRTILTIVALLIVVFGFVLGQLIGIDEGPHVALGVFIGFLIGAVVCLIPAMLLAGSYFRSLGYEIQDDEIIVRVGIVTKSVKHVPYRTVTNIKINRGILDRYVFNLGSLNIQTAGMSGSTGAEESLVGLVNVQEVYDAVARKLRSFRGGMSPTTAEVDIEPGTHSGAVLNEILNELKAIRKNTEK